MAKTKKAEAEAPVYAKIEGCHNIKGKRVGDVLYLRVNLAAETRDSQSGKAEIVASTPRFASLEEICGEDIGLNLIVSKRKAKAASKPSKKKAKARDDDDD